MKKYLIKGLLALVVGGFTASCADKDGDYVPVGQQKATAYADAFKELIGGEVAPNHDWGFTKTSIVSETAQTRANTRAFTRADGVGEVIKPDNGKDGIFEFTNDERNADGWRSPEGVSKYVAPITDAERAWVQAWFDNPDNRGLSDEGREFHNFYVQQVHNKLYSENADAKDGYFWELKNGVIEKDEREYHVKMDQLRIGSARDEASTVHINDFNATDNGFNAWNAIYVKNGSSKQFAYWASYGSQWQWKFRCVELEVPASCFPDNKPHKGWYVGLSYYCDKVEVAGQKGEIIGEDEIDICNDWILKIVPGDITPSGGETSSNSTSTRTDRIERRRLVSQGRVFCEDLGTDAARMTKSDIDFNDAVFDAKIWRLGQYDVTYVNGSYSSETDYLEGIYDNGLENGKFKYVAEIRLLAAGGTVPLKIGGNYGFEIHSKFGEGNNRTITHTTIINTMGAPSQANFSTTVSTETCDAVTVEVDITSLVAGKSEIGLDIIPIDVEWVSQTGQSVGELTADFGKVPQKLCVPIGTPWIYERIPITDAYKDFASYATSRTPLFWDGTKNESLLYPSIPEGMTAETGETGDVNTNPYHDRVVTEGQTVTETITETILWEGELAFAENTNGSDFTPSTLSFNEGDYIRIYGSTTNSSNNRVQIAFVDNTTNGWLTKKPYDQTNVNFTNGYVEGTLDATDISNLAGVTKFGVWGINVTITKISKVVKTRTTN